MHTSFVIDVGCGNHWLACYARITTPIMKRFPPWFAFPQEYLEKKYGKGAGSRMSVALGAAGAKANINFNTERRVHNTLRSHRLVRLADQQGKGDKMIEEIFHGYFEEGRNIADIDVLLELASKVRRT